ncbi:GNAT family N-acetyltransferase [Actinopolymorpha rutila]
MRIQRGEQHPEAVARLLAALPEWFGMPSAVEEYVASARHLPTYAAVRDGGTSEGDMERDVEGDRVGDVVGVLLLTRHFSAAEIHLMAVHPEHHRRGVGRALMEAVWTDLAAEGVHLLQVKTLGPSHPHEGYARTREFYRAAGFRSLEEIEGVWPGNPCLLMVACLRHG